MNTKRGQRGHSLTLVHKGEGVNGRGKNPSIYLTIGVIFLKPCAQHKKDRKNLVSGKSSFFTKGGKLNLIRSVLNGIQNYFLPFRVPCSVFKSNEKLMSGFLWQGWWRDPPCELRGNWKTCEIRRSKTRELQDSLQTLVGKIALTFPLEPNTL